MSEITKEDAYLRFNKELMKTVRVVAAVIKTVNENDEPIILLDECDAHLAESLFKHALGILHLILDLQKQR